MQGNAQANHMSVTALIGQILLDAHLKMTSSRAIALTKVHALPETDVGRLTALMTVSFAVQMREFQWANMEGLIYTD